MSDKTHAQQATLTTAPVAPARVDLQPRPFAPNTSSNGSPLPAAVHEKMAQAFGHDFSHVRIHQEGYPVPRIQAKLAIGQPRDKYEQEADRVASQVVEQINALSAVHSTPGQLVPRAEDLQATSIRPRREAIAAGEASTDLASAIHGARGSGQPLDAGLQQSMGRAIVADFSRVRVHTDAQSDRLNQSMQAKAFTVGQDVFFRQGAYEPGSRRGQKLIAHELTHVMQQNGGGVRRSFENATTPAPSPMVQRQIGEDGDGEKVVNTKTLRVYLAKRNTIGSYDLYSQGDNENYSYSLNVEKDDQEYELFDGFNESTSLQKNEFSIISDQAKRRVYTKVPFVEEEDDFTRLHEQGKGRDADFSYSDLSNALHSTLQNNQLSTEDINTAIEKGAKLPLEDEVIGLDPTIDKDLQLIPFHILKYQEFHTPPNLKTQTRQSENVWRQEELDLTRAWIQLPNAYGLEKILPELPESNENLNRLQDIYPGPIDIGFPPNEEKTLFTYPQNKAIFLLNKKVLLDSFSKRQKIQDEEERKKQERKILTESYIDVITNQEGSTVEEPEEYLRGTLGLKRSASSESLDLTDTEEDQKLIYDSDDDLETSERKRKTFLNTLGTQIKLQNRKILQDVQKINKAKVINKENLEKSKSSKRKHKKILNSLEDRHKNLFPELHDKFHSIRKLRESYQKKRNLLDEWKPEAEQSENIDLWEQYNKDLEDFGKTPIKELIKKSTGPLEGVGEKTLKNAFRSKSKKKRKTSKRSKKKRKTSVSV